ncbi:MAG: ABC transporter permease subunit [Halobacteriales archaeon]
MSWRLVARWVAADARRSRGLWTVVGVFAVVGAGAAALPAAVVGPSLTAEQALVFLPAPLRIVGSLVGLLAGYAVIAGPRSDGRLGLVLGLPVSRSALVVGAFAGRAAVVLAGVAAGLGAVVATVAAAYGTLPLGRLLAFGGLVGLLVVAMTALAVGLSAATATPGRAGVAAVAAFVGFQFFWDAVPAGAHYLVAGSLPGPVVPAWVVLLERLQPLAAFDVAATLVLPAAETGIRLSAGGAAATGAAGPTALADRLAGPVPVYLDPWASVVTLVAWTAVPLAAGWYRFRRADL